MDQESTPEESFEALHHVLGTIVHITTCIPGETLGNAIVFLESATPANDDEALERSVYLNILRMMDKIKQAM